MWWIWIVGVLGAIGWLGLVIECCSHDTTKKEKLVVEMELEALRERISSIYQDVRKKCG